MRRLLGGVVLACLAAVVLFAADGPLTPIANLRGRTDGNGYLLVSGGVTSGSDGPLTPIGQLRGRTDANGYLRVALTGGAFTGQLLAPDGTAGAPSYSFVNDTGNDTGMFLVGANQGGFSSNGGESFGWGIGALRLPATSLLLWTSGGISAGADLIVVRDAANVLAIKNSTTAQALRVYGTTTGTKYLSLSHDGTNGVIDTSATAGLLSIAPTNATSVAIGKAVSSLNGIATAGNGLDAIVATNRVTAQTGAAASIVTYTPTADASFELSANILVTTATTHSFTLTCTYTDEGNTSRTQTMPFVLVAGSAVTVTVGNAAGAVPYNGIPVRIRAKASTAITCQTTGTFTTVTYNAEAQIKRAT